MYWQELTGDEFPQAVAQAEGVCLLPLSVVERHAHHLPLGTDVLIARELCRRTAARKLGYSTEREYQLLYYTPQG